MDLLGIFQGYVERVVSTVAGYKALLLDKETLRFVSVAFNVSDLNAHDVYCTEVLDRPESTTNSHMELSALCFLRPTRQNIKELKRELKHPRFKKYHLFFTNVVNQTLLLDLAESDGKSMVAEVQEFFGDFQVIDPHHFHIPTPKGDQLLRPERSALQNQVEAIDRLVQGLGSILLSLKRKPAIRYRSGSESARRLAVGLHTLAYKEERPLFDFGVRGTQNSPLLLILDRRDDPVTPLLNQWTYQSMIHELIGIHDNTVRLSPSEKLSKDLRELVLSAWMDSFYKKYLYHNFGEVGEAVQNLVSEHQVEHGDQRNLQSIEEMKKFIMNYSETSQKKLIVTKHVNIMAELSKAVQERDLFTVSELEQDLVCSNNGAGNDLEEVKSMLHKGGLTDTDKLRLVMLWALRYEGDSRLAQLAAELNLSTRGNNLAAAAKFLLDLAGSQQRCGDLFGNRSLKGRIQRKLSALKGVDNVYTQHQPLLGDIIQNAVENKLPRNQYPYLAENQSEEIKYIEMHKTQPPKEVIIFIVGGTTYEESKLVSEFNAANQGVSVILGGSEILNSNKFVQQIMGLAGVGAHAVVDIL
eukprot:TRINITY_DN8971_c0_g1_i1.p1 TRINITY_DN8971_c0_g1~~TRINITY_DN8971_c0_g1_i1.p1  ORF type:complete len:582 (-),score=88.97 TRINITY_DN8971_c0_g1_i1:244-1989(-)